MHQTPQGYAMNQDNAEKAYDHPSEYSSTPCNPGEGSPGPKGKARDGDATVETKEMKTDPLNHRPDAKIWSLYLTEAEEKATQRVELWKTSLESLLIFAGLFAGVVASFVIDSRQDLQPNPEQVLLTDIRDALRGETASQEPFIPSTLSLWINGLWFSSLLITLFSAIMGVMAKAWLVDFMPVVSGQESGDAYQRWVRDDQAQVWHLEKVITSVPLLLQLALLLFLLGFGLQSIDDNPTMGRLALTLVGLGTLIYIIMTVLPIFSPWCPFGTPLSDALFDIASLYQSVLPHKSPATTPKDNARNPKSWRDGPDESDVLSEIWRGKLIQSTKPSNVDEAIAELSQTELSPMWWNRFVDWGTPMILCERLRESIVSNGQRESGYEVLCNHLRALLGFVDYLSSEPAKLSEILGEFLDSGEPLHRWNVFPEKIRALAFSARIPIMLACEEDYSASEMEERPWETMVHDMLPDHRKNFAIAACRGLVGDQENLQKVSALSIVISITNATVAAFGPKSEWGVGIEHNARHEAEHLGRKYIAKLYEQIAKGWKEVVLENLSKTLSVTINSDPQDAVMLGGLSTWLSHPNPKFRTWAITTLATLAADDDFGDAVRSSIPELAETAANHPDRDVLLNGMEALISFARNERFQDSAKQILSDSLQSALKNVEPSRRVRAIDNVVMLIQNYKFQTVFQDTVEPLLSDLIELTVSDWDGDVRTAGVKAIKSLMQDEELRDKFKSALPKVLISVFERLGSDRVDATLFQSPDLKDAVNAGMAQLVEVIMNAESPGIRIVGMKMVASLAQDDVLQDIIMPELPKILDIPWNDITSLAHAPWIEILHLLADQIDFRDSVKSAIPSLLKMITNGSDVDIHAAGVSALAFLMKDESLRDLIKLSLPSDLESALMNPEWQARICTIGTLIKLIEHPDLQLQDTIEAVLPKLIQVAVNDDNDDVRAAGVESLVTLMQGIGSVSLSLQENLESAFRKFDPWNRFGFINALGQNANFRDVVQSAILNFIEMAVSDDDADVQVAGVKAVAALVQDDKFQDVVGSMVSNILGSKPRDFPWKVRIAWFEMLVILAENPNFRSSVEFVLPKFADLAIKDGDEDVRVAGMMSLVSIAKIGHFYDIIKPDLTAIINSTAKDPNWPVRVAWAKIQVMLAEIPDFQASAESKIPELVEMVIRDGDEDVRISGINSLVDLAQNEKLRAISPTVQGTIKSGLLKSLDSAFKDPHSRVRLAWIKALVALGQRPEFRDNVQLAIPKLVKMTGNDEDSDVRKAAVELLTSLAKDKKLQDVIILALPKSLDSVFADSSLHTDWSRILDTLIHRDAQLGGAAELVIPKIAEITIQNDDKNTRVAMVNLLVLFANDAKLRDTTRSTLSKSLDSALTRPDWEIRAHAIEVLSGLAPDSNLQGAVTPVLSQLLKFAVNGENEDVRKAAVELLRTLRTNSSPGARTENRPNIGDAILLVVPSAILLIGPEGHAIRRTIDSLLPFAGPPTDLEHTPESMARVLVPLLKGSLWLTRATTVEFLAVLNKYTNFRQFIESTVPEIIALAIEDKEDGVRAAGIRSLANLAEEDTFRDKIKPILPQLMPLLDVSHLRDPVTELISLLAVDEIVRKDIISWIINPLIQPKMETYPKGLLELLTRLIMDNRFDCQRTSDNVVLFVASVVLMQPHAPRSRFRAAVSLWCHYGKTYTRPQPSNIPERLVEQFLFTIFGRHVSQDEVNKWHSLSSHLPSIAESSLGVEVV